MKYSYLTFYGQNNGVLNFKCVNFLTISTIGLGFLDINIT